MDYSYETLTTSTTSDPTGSGVPAGLVISLVLVYLVALVFMIVAMWKLYAKAGKPGWAAIVPIYNVIVLLQIIGRPLWWIVLFFIPFVNVVVAIITTNDTAKVFGKSVGWTVGLIFLPIIFYPMLAFGSAKYIAPSVKNS